MQDAPQGFLVLPSAHSLVEVPEDSEALLRVVVRNMARSRCRRHHARLHLSEQQFLESLPEERDSVEELVTQAEEHVRLLGGVTQLGAIQRRVVELRMLEWRSGGTRGLLN